MDRQPKRRQTRVSTATTHASVDCRSGTQAIANAAVSPDACVGEAGLDAMMDAARELWPRKTALQLALEAGASERRAEQWLARTANPSGTNVIRLLHSRWGETFFFALMSVGSPPWFASRERALRMARLKRELEQLEKGDL